MIEIDSSRRKMMNRSTQPAKMPGFNSGIVIRRKVVSHVAPAMRELWSSSSEIASMIDETLRWP